MKRKPVQGRIDAPLNASRSTSWAGSSPTRTGCFPFLNATGLTPETLRASAGEPSFLAGILDHVMGDEAVLTACANGLGIAPERSRPPGAASARRSRRIFEGAGPVLPPAASSQGRAPAHLSRSGEIESAKQTG